MVGVGPAHCLDRTPRAEAAIRASDVVIGYRRYLEYVSDLTCGKRIIASGMGQELQRCRTAVELAECGSTVSIISSGDAGVYGMAGLVLELAETSAPGLDIEIVPGITAANAAAALVGAPLMLDYAVISLSDLLVPWDMIRRRLEAVVSADLVVVLYNPRSHNRTRQFDEALTIFRRYRSPGTPVAVVSCIGLPEQRAVVTKLKDIESDQVDMRSIVIVGNSQSRLLKTGYFVTPRGYRT